MPDRVRVAAGAGFAADRIAPAVDLARDPRMDYLVFECLAERTIALAQLDRLENPERGFNPWLEERMRRVLPHCAANDTTVVTNMGAVNPQGGARRTAEIADELGLDLTVVAVSGSDVLDRLDELAPTTFDGEPLADYRPDVVAANAYLGIDAILEALAAGADVVITDRVSDVSLFLAPIVHEFGWDPDPRREPDRIGQGIVTAHLLECAAQVTGGFFADPGVKDVPDLERLGFPYAVVDADGAVEVTKLEAAGGRVSPATCTEQLLYEIADPGAYVTPDGVADFTGVRFEEVAPDRVAVRGATAGPRPEALKVSVGYEESFIGEGEMSYAGPNALARGELARSAITWRLERGDLPIEIDELTVDLIGVDALHGPVARRRSDAEPYEVRVRVAARCPTRRDASNVTREVRALTLNGPAGGGGGRRRVTRNVGVVSTTIDRAAVTPTWTRVETGR